MFVVTKKFGRSETRLRDFTKETEAKQFIQEQLHNDVRFKLTASYGLYEGADLLQEFTQKDIILQSSDDDSSGGSSGQGTGNRSSFSPTPFSTSPRPTGMPQHWSKKEEDDKENP
jgi:hypothetical protein